MSKPSRSHLPMALGVAATSGFIALSYELVWYRVFSFFTWGSAASFGVLLGAYLLGVALGSYGSRRFCADRTTEGNPSELLPLGIFLFAANLLSFLAAPILAWGYTRTMTFLPLGIVTLAAGSMGAILPLTSHFAIAPDDRAGAKLSYLYLANILGGTAGSLLTGFVFLESFSIRQTSVILSVVGSAASAVLVLASVRGSGGEAAKRSAAGIGLALTVAGSLASVALAPKLYDQIYERLFFKRKFKEEFRFGYVVENKHGVIAVTKEGMVLGGGAYDGKISTDIVHDVNGIKRAYALSALHPRPKRVLMIGLATGGWAQVIVNNRDVEEVRAIEINPGYLEIIQREPAVAPILTNPKFHLEIDDGHRWLLRHPDEKFDAVVMNTTWNWRGHSTNLLSLEFMQLVRQHLQPGGILYYNTTSSPEAQKTAMVAFPYALRVYNFMAVSDSVLRFDVDRFRDSLEHYTLDGVPAIDTSTDEGRKVVDDLVAWGKTQDGPPQDDGIEKRETLFPRLEGVRTITDDNMATEFIEPLRRPEPVL